MDKRFDFENISDDIEDHDDHPEPYTKVIVFFFSLFKGEHTEAELSPVAVPRREVAQHDRGDRERNQALGHLVSPGWVGGSPGSPGPPRSANRAASATSRSSSLS